MKHTIIVTQKVIFEVEAEKPHQAFMEASKHYPRSKVEMHYVKDEFDPEIEESWKGKGYHRHPQTVTNKELVTQ